MKPIVGGELMLLGYDVTTLVIVGGVLLGVIGFLLAVAAFSTDESASESADRKALQRKVQLVAVLLVLAGGYVYASQYAVDGHCTQQNWDTLMGNYGYWEAIVIWYVIAGC